MKNFQQKPYPTYLKTAKSGDRVNMFIEEIEGIPENSNPFHYDCSRMGASIAADVMAMYSTPFRDSALVDFRLIHQKTGQVFKVWSTPQVQVPETLVDIDSVDKRTLGVISLTNEEFPMNAMLPAGDFVKRMGGVGLAHVFIRDENGGPVSYTSKLGTFDVPLYLGYGLNAILLSKIPHTIVENTVTMTRMDIDELRQLIPDYWEADEVHDFINEVIWFIQKDLPNIK